MAKRADRAVPTRVAPLHSLIGWDRALQPEEGVHHLGIEPALPFVLNRRQNPAQRPGGTVGPIVGQGVEEVRQGNQSGFEWNGRACPPIRVAPAVPALMMRARDGL